MSVGLNSVARSGVCRAEGLLSPTGGFGIMKIFLSFLPPALSASNWRSPVGEETDNTSP